MKLPLLLFAALPALAEPEYELWTHWFDCDAVRGVTNGVACARTEAGLSLTPRVTMPSASAAVLESTCVFSEADVGAARELVACRDDVQLALSVASTAKARLAYFAWTADGWTELAGSEPVIGRPVAFRFELDYGQTPAVVRLFANGVALAAAEGSRREVLPLAAASERRLGALAAGGAIEMPVASGEREQVDNVVAVVQDDRVVGYHATLDAARAAAGAGRVVILRRTTLRDASALSGETEIHASALGGTAPALTYVGDASRLAQAEPVLALPRGWTGDAPLIAPPASNVLAAVHLHGDEGVPYALYPSEDALRVRRDELNVDGGAFTAFLTVPENGRSFLRGLRDGMCGSENALYVNGIGSLTLCGTNEFTGSVFVEASALQDAGVLRPAAVGVLSQPAGLEFMVSARMDESPVTTETDGRVVLANVADDLAGALTVRLDPGPGRVGFLARVGNSLVARVAAAPSLAAEDGFAAAPDASTGMMRIVAKVGNAAPGFRYGWQAADSVSGPFESVGETVTATSPGELEVSLEEPARDSRYYRFKVEAP